MPLFGPPDVARLEARRNVKGLVKALRYEKDRRVREAAAAALGRIGDPCTVEPLARALGELRGGAAAWALGEIGDARAVEPLIAALGQASDDGHRSVIEALGKLGGPRAVGQLIELLGSEKADERTMAGEALVRLGPAAVPHLVLAMWSTNWRTPGAAADLLDTIGWRPDETEAGARYWVIRRDWTSCVRIGVPAIRPLIAALHHGSAEALLEIGAPAVEPLIAALGDPGGSLHEPAAVVLGRTGDARAVVPLTAALEDPDLRVRRAAAEALGALGWASLDGSAGAPPVGHLLGALTDRDRLVRTTAARGLVALYRSGALDEGQKVLLLAQRDVITHRHTDREVDDTVTCKGIDFTTHGHADDGIGVRFTI
jgi:HEAT repeat protein